MNNRCTNLLYWLNVDADVKKSPYEKLEEIALGPMCFVRDQGPFVKARPCFETCTDMALIKLGCTQEKYVERNFLLPT